MKKLKPITLFAILATIFVISPFIDPSNFVSGHSTITYPTEIFSLWNNTAPTLDGGIDFSSGDMSTEWSSAAVYNLYNSTNNLAGKLLLQNNDVNLFIGMDVINFQVEDPATTWGSSVYFDVNHDGLLSLSDRLIRFTDNSSGQYVEYYYYSTSLDTWMQLEDGSLGVPLSSSGIVVASAFQTSEFDSSNNHRQYEIKIPLTALSISTGDAIGIGFEATDNYLSSSAGITWPYIGTDQDDIRLNAGLWGDLQLEANTYDSFDFVVEENFNIKSTAVGYNNGTYLTTGDIDGNGDFELIVSSNRTVTGDRNLIAIFDYRSGSYQRIWSSWTTSHQSKLTTVIPGLATFDFDANGEDELYCIGTSNTVLRFRDWNSTSNDFEVSEVIYTHTSTLMGYIAIGEVVLDPVSGDSHEIVFGDSNGNIVILVYESATDTFDHDKKSPFSISSTYRIHAVGYGNIDHDAIQEVLFFGQTTADDALSHTTLYVYRRWENQKLEDNVEDDLPSTSSSTTEDYFGHTIIVDDVDNDNKNETVVVGSDYLRIFDNTSFTDLTPPLELSLNDPSAKPISAGGAAVADINLDGLNELIFSSNNGTIYIGEVSDTGTLEFTLSWSGDFGSSFGKRNSIVVFDIDNDGQNEIVLGDQYGQIIVLGIGDPPEITINSPSPGYVSSQDKVLVDWDVTTEFESLHHIDVYVNGGFSKRIGGSQTSTEVFLIPGQNVINLTAYSMSGLISSTNVTVKFDVKAPQVTIISPENYYETSADLVEISYSNSDPDFDFNHYEIWRNDTNVVPFTLQETISISLPFDSVWNITVVAVDDTLLEGKSSIYVIRDTAAPFINITAPIDGAAVKTTDVDLIWDSYDILTDVDHYEIYLDSVYQDSTTLKSYTVGLTIDKTYLIEIYAFDVLGNNDFDSISITLDTLNPTVSFDPIALPQLPDSTYYTNNQFLAVSWNATDDLLGSGISHTQITINGLLFDTYLPGTTSDTLDLVVDNYKEVEITAFDQAGNTATDVFGVKLDRTVPEIEITLPADNYTTGSDYVLVTWDATDLGVGLKEYRVYVDSILEATITNIGTTSYLVNIPENKTYTVTIRAYDLLDYYNESSIDIIHDSTYPTVIITTPTRLTSYTNDSIVHITWETVNLDVDHFEIHINGVYNSTYSNTTLEAFINFGFIALDVYPAYNITVLAFLSNGTSYLDLRWIIFDTTSPELSYITPLDDDIITNSNLHVEWFSQDDGSDIDYFRIEIGGITVIKDEILPFSSIINVSSLNGIYELIIFGYDIAGNIANISINIEITLYAPVFTTSLESIEYLNSGNFQFDLSVIDPNSGVKSISIYIDNTNEIYFEDFGIDYAVVPFDRIINVNEINFLSGVDNHNISISVFDKVNREERLLIEIVIDKEMPDLLQQPIIGALVFGTSAIEIVITSEPGTNNHTLFVLVTDNTGISGVNVTLTGYGYNQTFQMLYNDERDFITLGEYSYDFNFDDFTEGDYQITLAVIDIAGNVNYFNYGFSLKFETIDGPGNLGLIIALVIATIVVVAAVLAVSIRKPIRNIGWQDEIVNLSYILRSGLTVLYIPFSHEMIRDEQLFGGAMSGIRNILEELIGSKRKYAVDNVEFGNKNLLIYSSAYGDTILVVDKIKPIHAQKLEQFANEFEFIYRDAVTDDTYVNISRFDGYIDVVSKYFGSPDISEDMIAETILPKRKRQRQVTKAIKEIEITDKDLLIKSLHHKLSLDEASIENISQQTKVYIGDAIILAEKALTSLIEYDCDQAVKYAKISLSSLNLATQSGENLSIFEDVLNAIPRIVEEVNKGSACEDNEDRDGLYKAIENVSKLYLEYIEKFSI
ncbi:MAG: VCBS repeat-containing protein [Asgard group archaeon]|nr:VCBS repeat-containing protein [Asgard group archaeon]